MKLILAPLAALALLASISFVASDASKNINPDTAPNIIINAKIEDLAVDPSLLQEGEPKETVFAFWPNKSPQDADRQIINLDGRPVVAIYRERYQVEAANNNVEVGQQQQQGFFAQGNESPSSSSSSSSRSKGIPDNLQDLQAQLETLTGSILESVDPNTPGLDAINDPITAMIQNILNAVAQEVPEGGLDLLKTDPNLAAMMGHLYDAAQDYNEDQRAFALKSESVPSIEKEGEEGEEDDQEFEQGNDEYDDTQGEEDDNEEDDEEEYDNEGEEENDDEGEEEYDDEQGEEEYEDEGEEEYSDEEGDEEESAEAEIDPSVFTPERIAAEAIIREAQRQAKQSGRLEQQQQQQHQQQRVEQQPPVMQRVSKRDVKKSRRQGKSRKGRGKAVKKGHHHHRRQE